jgi:hypothetical protein
MRYFLYNYVCGIRKMSSGNSLGTTGTPIIRAGSGGPPPNMPPEKPSVPIAPILAKRRAEYVRENIALIRQLRTAGADDSAIFSAVGTFADGFPGLFKALLKNDTRTEIYIQQTLAMLDKMAAEELTQGEASAIIGKKAADAFVKPVIDSLGGDKPKNVKITRK